MDQMGQHGTRHLRSSLLGPTLQGAENACLCEVFGGACTSFGGGKFPWRRQENGQKTEERLRVSQWTAKESMPGQSRFSTEYSDMHNPGSKYFRPAESGLVCRADSAIIEFSPTTSDKWT